MMNKGQISQTMNWVVATIVIIIILVISFFLVKSGGTGSFILPDKEKDFVATKSIVNFVENNYNLIETSVAEKDYNLLNQTLNPFLLDISLLEVVIGPAGKTYAWNVDLLDKDNKKKFGVITYGAFGRNTHHVKIVLDEDNKLNFWKACVLC